MKVPICGGGRVGRGAKRGHYKNLDKYSVTMDKFGGLVTAPIKRTMFGCRRSFIIVTYQTKEGEAYLKFKTKKVQGNYVLKNLNASKCSAIMYLTQKFFKAFGMKILFH